MVIGFYSLFIWTIELLVYAQVAAAFSQEMTIAGLSLFLAAVNFSSLIPAAPGGIGVIEWLSTLALVHIGIESETALAMVGTQHLIQIVVVGLPGALFVALHRGGTLLHGVSEGQDGEEAPASNASTSATARCVMRDLQLSVIVPAYNEEGRLEPTLQAILGFCRREYPSFELIVVDDGSNDRTAELVKRYAAKDPAVRLISYRRNRGKGHAVRTGMNAARGRFRLFDDADGSTPISEVQRLLAALERSADIAIGSRAKPSDETAVEALWYRKLIGRVFNTVVNMLIVPDISDTQCGFKLFTAEAADQIFPLQRAEGFSFDVEILFLARRAGLKVIEVPVNWTNVPGSKVNLAVDSMKMFFDIIGFRLRYFFGGYYRTTLGGEESAPG